MEEKEISGNESFLIIEQMIQAAKQEQKDDGKGWIIWGWLLFFASLGTYFNLKFQWVGEFFFWNLFGITSIVMLVYASVRKILIKKTSKVKTYSQEVLEKLNIGFLIVLLLIIISMNTGGVHPIQGFALLLGLYGFWIMVYGAVLDFKPSLIGAFITWAFALVSLFVKNFEYTMLLHAVAVLCGYIIPGHIANREFNHLQPVK